MRPSVIATLLAALPRLGAADTLGVIAVAPPPGPSAELVEATAQLRQALAGRRPGEVLEAQKLRDRMSGDAGGASLAELDRAFEGARSAALSGDYEGSAKTLRAIVEELEKLPDGEEAFGQWTRAMMRLAKTEGDLGNADSARGVIDRLLRADPDARVDPALYPPKFARQVEEARAQLKALPRHKLTVTSASKGVQVFVNGRAAGQAPVTLSLARGRYRVSGSADGLRAPTATVELAEGDQTVPIDFSVQESLRPARGPGLALAEQDRARRIVTAGGFLGLDSVLASSFAEEAGVPYLVGSLYDVRRGMLKLEGRVRLGAGRAVPAGGVAALAEFLVTGQPNRLVEEPPRADGRPAQTLDLRPRLSDRQVEARPGGVSKTKGWVAFGTGLGAVALGGVALWQGLSAKKSWDDARKIPIGSPDYAARYNGKISDGDTANKIAIGAGVGAGVCLVTSGVLGYLAYKQTGEIGPFRF